MWTFRGQRRPDFAVTPGPDEESVWDYPRPPRIHPDHRLVTVQSFDDTIVARSEQAVRIMETASPPTFYLPPDDVRLGLLVDLAEHSSCEWKGTATYVGLASNPGGEAIGWYYSEPSAGFAALRGYISFYPGRIACYVGAERVRPQPGHYYGGWVTKEVVGPFKGDPGSGAW